jgi:hypothetical protein
MATDLYLRFEAAPGAAYLTSLGKHEIEDHYFTANIGLDK